MTKMTKTEWTEEMLETLRAEFPNTLNRELAEKLCVGLRTMLRKARELELTKEPNFQERHKDEISERIKMGQKHSENTGWKRYCFRKGQAATGRPFQKGHNNKERMGEERFRLMIEKATQSRLRTIKLEKARAAFGLPQKTKLRVDRQSTTKKCQNYYLRKRGYILDIKRGIAYWTETTTRAKVIEAKGRFFKFMQLNTVQQ